MENEILLTKMLNILSLEDSDIDFELICEQLDHTGFKCHISRVVTETEFTSAIRNNFYSIILADFNLPQFDAFSALNLCREYCPDVPFICVSGSIGEVKAVELLKKGAVDYVIKDRMDRLPFAIKRSIAEAEIKLEHKKAQEALRNSEERFRDILFSTSDWVWEVDEYGRYTYSSQRDVDLFDFTHDDIIGKTPFDFMSKEEAARVETIFSEIAAHKMPIRDLENWNIGKNGQLICLLTNGVPILDEEGNLRGYRGIDKNITERKHAEQELIKAKEKAEESDRLKTAFLSNMSHEIRTPLNSIIGFSDLLLDPFFAEEQRIEFVSMIKQSGTNLMSIISDIMDISKIETRQVDIRKKQFSVIQLILDISNEQSYLVKEKGLEIKINNPEQDVLMNGDKGRIKQILLNFVSNAIKFSDQGYVEIGYKHTQNSINIYVKDNGIGIPKEFHEKVFDRFLQVESAHTRKYGGNGLGLTISKQLAELMGGEVRLESEPGSGSTFSLILPV